MQQPLSAARQKLGGAQSAQLLLAAHAQAFSIAGGLGMASEAGFLMLVLMPGQERMLAQAGTGEAEDSATISAGPSCAGVQHGRWAWHRTRRRASIRDDGVKTHGGSGRNRGG